ncbi:hypothetical protein ARA02_05020 [Leuconostoc mesenteroides subsp. jonggajibkimchii]|nr:hypothetical protein ARA02_05020 [Leuconostoc mesenteroides subsp. jonggajibkimchii]
MVDTTPVKLIGGSKSHHTQTIFHRLNVMALLPAGCYAPSILAFVTTKTLTSQANLRTKVQRFGLNLQGQALRVATRALQTRPGLF